EDGRVEGDLHDLGMARGAGADLLVSGVGRVAAGVAGHDALDAAQVLEDGLQAPEATAAQRRLLFFAVFLHFFVHCRPPFLPPARFRVKRFLGTPVCRRRSCRGSPASGGEARTVSTTPRSAACRSSRGRTGRRPRRRSTPCAPTRPTTSAAVS